MKVVYNPKTNTLEIAEKSLFRKFTFRRINVCGFTKSGAMYFSRSNYLSNEYIEICEF